MKQRLPFVQLVWLGTALAILQFGCKTQTIPVKKDRVLVWSDEFDQDGLPNPAIWGYDVGGHGWGNNELQFYTEGRKENARIEQGKLIIEARKEAWEDKKYTSARLVTRNKKPILYGRIEARAKLPKGVGSWPAIWMLGQNIQELGWPLCGEIDIMEHVGFDQNRVHGSIHTKAYNHNIGTQKTASRMVEGVSENFHIYAVEWTPTQITFLINDMPYLTFNKDAKADNLTWPFDKPHYLLLNIAVGGFWGGQKGVEDQIFPLKMEVDYVRVYQSL